ncbi:MAG: type I 3-dehydroquinate dehydratase [Candidatus Rhabdochlamydia sp.]
MTLVCAPVKVWPQNLQVDLYEFEEGRVKTIYNQNRELVFTLIDWEEEVTSFLTPLIVSYHNYQETKDLELILEKMKQKWPLATYYKIATFATSSLDALRMLVFQKQNTNVIGICMGKHGSITRILSPIVSAPLTYAPLTEEDQNAPGQLTWKELLHTYHFPLLNKQTRIYGVIGDPVSQSVGHLFHNDQFKLKGKNKVYVKIKVKEQELAQFFECIESLPFQGLSVTAPLKEKVLPFLHTRSPVVSRIGASNTLVRTENGWEGDNTDGEAALKGLGDLSGQTAVILGAGGAARAVIYALLSQKARVVIWNRTPDKARALSQEFQCEWAHIFSSYDLLINTTSSSLEEVDIPWIKKALVIDISLKPSSFLERAALHGCQVMGGFSMYIQQAIKQQELFE